MTEPVAEGSLLLHIGPQKTGSTAIQHAMHRGRRRLAEHGVHYVGARPVERQAGWAVLGLEAAVGRRAPRSEDWQRLVDEITAATEARLCLSNEDFGRADDAAVARILEGTGAERTHVVYVARRLDKVLPSHWQQQVRARQTASYADFLRVVLDPEAQTWLASLVMAPQDVGAVLARWGTVLPPERMTVVVAEENDHTALPRAFESLLALPEGLLAPPDVPANRSLGLPETDALRHVNRVAIDEKWTPTEYRNLVQLGVVKALKRRPVQAGPRIVGIPVELFDRVADLADAQVEAIRSSGACVVGDPEVLRVRGAAEPVPPPPESGEIDLDLLADVVGGLRAGSRRLSPSVQVSADQLHSQLSGRELLHLLARRAAAALGVRRHPEAAGQRRSRRRHARLRDRR